MAKDNRTKVSEIKQELIDIEQHIERLKQLASETDGRFQGVQTQKIEAARLSSEIEALKNRADTLATSIEQKSIEANKSIESITELVTSAEESKDVFEEHSRNLNEIEDKIKGFEKEISEQLGRAGAGALAVSFADRQGKVEEELIRWRDHLYQATGLLIIVAFGFLGYSFYTIVNLEFF